jgi:hypothetical protein
MATTVQLTPNHAANPDDKVSGKTVMLKIDDKLGECYGYWLKMK